MYPFRILIVRKDDNLLMRVVYQEGLPNVSANGVYIKCCSCPELDINAHCGTIFLRGDQPDLNHRVNRKIERYVSYDTLTFFNKVNNQIKTHVSV
jgi:hypothetical protein